jgi:hypothetical protein
LSYSSKRKPRRTLSALLSISLAPALGSSFPSQETETFSLFASDGQVNDRFGGVVAIDGAFAVIGSNANGVEQLSGAAYIFDTTTGLELSKIEPDDGVFFDLFGNSVAIEGNTVVVGSPFDDQTSAEYSGSAYLFDPSSAQQVAKLVASDLVAEDFFGWSVAIN